MVGYRLGNTVTGAGRVCRGLCRTKGGFLDYIEEFTHVVKTPDGPAYSLDGGETLRPLPADTTVSMNFWGFTSGIFDEIERRFPRFLANEAANDNQAEMLVRTSSAKCCARACAAWRSCAARTSGTA